jgi:hypothetical protein
MEHTATHEFGDREKSEYLNDRHKSYFGGPFAILLQEVMQVKMAAIYHLVPATTQSKHLLPAL